ncbi:MAG: indolepyruvate oxidoreductase subunit beta, partial [Clostridiaceae bacterium]|nr:indolepyruvate oxidoreductase subunit beta [Clostridiaceae bacterium]
YRALKYLKRGGKLIINTQNIDPMPVIVGEAKYPEGIFDKIREKNVEFTQVNATEIAKACGNIKAVNVVLIGVLAKNTKIDKEVWIKAIEDTVPEKFKEVNVNAFLKGYEI